MTSGGPGAPSLYRPFPTVLLAIGEGLMWAALAALALAFSIYGPGMLTAVDQPTDLVSVLGFGVLIAVFSPSIGMTYGLAAGVTCGCALALLSWRTRASTRDFSVRGQRVGGGLAAAAGAAVVGAWLLSRDDFPSFDAWDPLVLLVVPTLTAGLVMGLRAPRFVAAGSVSAPLPAIHSPLDDPSSTS